MGILHNLSGGCGSSSPCQSSCSQKCDSCSKPCTPCQPRSTPCARQCSPCRPKCAPCAKNCDPCSQPCNPCASIAQAPSSDGIKSQYVQRVAIADDGSWVIGQLFYIHEDGGTWIVRYAPLSKEDKYGGGVAL